MHWGAKSLSSFPSIALGWFTEPNPLSARSVGTPLTDSGNDAGSLSAKASASAEMLDSVITWKAGKSWQIQEQGGGEGEAGRAGHTKRITYRVPG